MEEGKKVNAMNERTQEIQAVEASVKRMKDFTSPEQLYEELIRSIRKYHPSTDISMVEKAYQVAAKAHSGQVRKSGEPYIIHPLCVAIVLADLELDKETIVAGLLHDVVEDTVMTQGDRQDSAPRWRFWWTESPSWASCPTPEIRWSCRQKTCVRCFWPWQKTSG